MSSSSTLLIALRCTERSASSGVPGSVAASSSSGVSCRRTNAKTTRSSPNPAPTPRTRTVGIMRAPVGPRRPPRRRRRLRPCRPRRRGRAAGSAHRTPTASRTQKTLPKIRTPITRRITWPMVVPNGSKKPLLNTNMNATEMNVTNRMDTTCVHARLLATSLRRRMSTSARMPRAVLSNASVTRAPESQAIFMPSTKRSANGERISSANQSRAGGSPTVRARAAMLTTAGRSLSGALSADRETASNSEPLAPTRSRICSAHCE